MLQNTVVTGDAESSTVFGETPTATPGSKNF